MAINPVNLLRISHNLQTSLVTSSLQRSQLELYNSQTRIATGRSFITPSDDPITAARAMDLTQALERQSQFMANLRHGDNVLAAADSAITEVNTMLTEAHTIASQDVGDMTTAAEREADAELIAAIRQQLMVVGNRQFDDRYLFAGRDTTGQPFVDALGGVAYTGDTGDLITRISEDQEAVINVPGNVLFGALSSRVVSDVDLRPVLNAATRLEDLSGASGRGIQAGRLVFNEADGVGVFTVNLEAADTAGDLVALINTAAAEAGSALTAIVSDRGITITPGNSAVTITDTSAGVVAGSLGILTRQATTDVIEGADLGTRLTRLTPVEALAQGAGIDLEGGLLITNGPQSEAIDLSTAETVQDIINAINNAGLYVLARISESGRGIEVLNQVSGSALSIAENTGTTAADLGIRSLSTTTTLDELNDGLGITLNEGADDIRITSKNGAAIDVNLDGAVTIGEVIDLINAAATEAGVNVTATFAEASNGIRLVDATGGAGDLSVSSLNLSMAASELGFTGSTAGEETELISEDRNPIRTQGIFTALVDLESALRSNDTRGIAAAAQRLDPLTKDVTREHGILGARSQGMREKLEQLEDAAAVTEIFLSEIKDLDYAEAVTQLQSSVTQLQASMQTSSALLTLSLLDFLA